MISLNWALSMSVTGFCWAPPSKVSSPTAMSSDMMDEMQNFTTRASTLMTGLSRSGARTPLHWLPV